MGLFSALRLTKSLTPTLAPVTALGSPWAGTALSSIVWADLLDSDLLPMSRAEAMTVPAMARARHLLAGSVATCPLRALRGPDVLPDANQPAWMYRTDGMISPYHRMLWTADDLLFYGWSLWVVDRGTDRGVIAAERLPREAWEFGTDGRSILVGGSPVNAADVVLIPGPHEGVLAFGARTLRGAAKLERAAARHAANPVPSVELRQTSDVELSEKERDALVSGWVAARASETGAVGFTSFGIEAHVLGAVPEQLLIEGRNAAAVDIGRMVSIPAAMLDATTAAASLTYETTTGRNEQFLDYGVRIYLDAIAARLSADDVVPRGQRTAFDTDGLTSLAPSTTGTPTLD